MYCTQQNLVDRFGETELIQLTDRDNIGVIDTSVLARAITDAGCEMDSYLTGYSLPLATVPDNFERIACDIARYYLYDNLMAEQVKARYESCIRYLKDVSKGLISLGPDNSGTVSIKSSGHIQINSAPSVFGRY